MRFAGPFTLTLAAAALCLCLTSAGADDLAVSSNPYSSIPERNVFALVPIPPPAPPGSDTPPPDPPPKITVNGTMSIFGKPQVLFKFTPKTPPGQPPKEESRVLGEGERQDDIEVTKIDMVGRMVSFINHGLAQDIPVADVAKLNTPVSGPGGGVPRMPPAMGGIPLPPTTAPPTAPPQSVGRGTRGRSLANPDSGNGPATAASAGQTPIEDEVMKAANQIAQMEQARIDTQPLVDKGLMPPIPPTALTPADATAHDGTPLVANPPK